MVGALALAIVLAPSAAIVLIALTRQPNLAAWLNLLASVVSFAAAVPMPWRGRRRPACLLGRLCRHRRARRLGDAVFRRGLSARLDLRRRLHASAGQEERLPVFYALFAGFALTTLFGPMMNNAGLYWIAIELTTLVSTFLVASNARRKASRPPGNTSSSSPAASASPCWAPCCSTGPAASCSGPTYDMTWAALAAGRTAHEPRRCCCWRSCWC